jgi:hypothetical protein
MDTLERELREETGKNNLPGVMLAAANIDGMLSVRPFKAETPQSIHISRYGVCAQN